MKQLTDTRSTADKTATGKPTVKDLLKKIPPRPAITLSVFVLAAAVFVLIPFPASDLYIRFYFDNIGDDSYGLYYSTDSAEGFSQERLVPAEADYSDMHITFRLDSSLAGRITGLRLDFPCTEQLLCIKNITVSSAGIIKRQYNPSCFFLEENLASSNDVDSITPVAIRDLAYIATLPDDPYLIFSSGLCQQITGCYSHFRLTRLLVCLFPAACCLVAKTKIFAAS